MLFTIMLHFKCVAVRYANLSSNPKFKPYLRAVEYPISFFSDSHLRLFCQKLYEKTVIFNANFVKTSDTKMTAL